MNYFHRTYGRDGDTYGRHALDIPGGNSVQRDVLHVMPTRFRDGRRIHPTRFNPDYVGAHRYADNPSGVITELDVVDPERELASTWLRCDECNDPLRASDGYGEYHDICRRCATAD